jgi:hypothetical protein
VESKSFGLPTDTAKLKLPVFDLITFTSLPMALPIMIELHLSSTDIVQSPHHKI